MHISQTTLISIIIAVQIGIAIAIVLEVYHFRRRRTVITIGQFILRMIVGAIFFALLIMILGDTIGAFKFRSTESELLFWMSCMLMTLALFFLLLVDAHMLYRNRMRMRERLYEDLARDMLRSIVKRTAEGQDEDNEQKQQDDQKQP